MINEAGAEIYWRRILDRYCCSLKAALLITIISAIVMVRVSYMTSAPDYSKIKNMSFGTITDELLGTAAMSQERSLQRKFQVLKQVISVVKSSFATL
ncbi:MAG: hypothetical protein WCQ21_34355 [Verrucomicrobiota bacterium]